MPSDTYQSYALLRSNLKSSSDVDVAKAVAYGKRIKVYPLSQAAHPPDTQFIDAIDVVFDTTIPYDVRFFQSLDRIVQMEPWLTRDKAMIDQLKSIGIEKGKPFNPDAATQDILEQAALEAHAWFATSIRMGILRLRALSKVKASRHPDRLSRRCPWRQLLPSPSSAPSISVRDSSI